ncbi:MAG: PspC domain-containing protein [Verrucomicrobia bacterium]|nr:PspC domain-containing protein [Verrucomicrobiota bacterium]
MNNPKLKLLLLISLLAALGAVLSAFAAGSHFHIGFNNGAFNFDFKVGTGDSWAATVLGLVALVAGLVSVSQYLSRGNQAGGEAASAPGVASWSDFSDFADALRSLTKSKTDVWLGGVCGGLGEHTPLPSWVWRLVFLLLLCCYGTGVLLYVLLWICLPEPRQETEELPPPSSTAAN